MSRTSSAFATAILVTFSSFAAIPVRWTTDTFKVKPLSYECYHGETLDLAASLTAYGEPLALGGKAARMWWQTPDMGDEWYETNAVVRVDADTGATNVLAAVFSGAYDTGKERVTGFVGVVGENYRAAFELRFRASPGFEPSALPLPAKTIDCAKVTFLNPTNAPWATGGGGECYVHDVQTNGVSAVVGKVARITIPSTDGLASTAYVDGATNATYVAATNSAAADAEAKYQPKGAYATNASISNDFPIVTNAYTAAEADGKFLSQASPEVSGLSVYWGGVGLNINAPVNFDYQAYYAEKANFNEASFTGELLCESIATFNEYTTFKGGVDFYNDVFFNNRVYISGSLYIEETPFSTITNDLLATASMNATPIATNAAEAVFAEHADYALTNLTGVSVNLASGQIGNVSLTALQPTLSVSLDFSAAADRSGDCLLYLVNGTNVAMSVGNADVTTVGWDGAALNAGTNLVMFTRVKREGDKSLVMVSTKEVK